MDNIKPKDIKPIVYGAIQSILKDAKLTNTIQHTIAPLLANYFNEYIKNNNSNNNRRYFDVVATMSEQSNPQTSEEDEELSRVRIRQLLKEEIKHASSADLRLKYIAELNKFDDNYKHGKNESNIDVTLTQFKPPSDWCKYLQSKGLCPGYGSSST